MVTHVVQALMWETKFNLLWAYCRCTVGVIASYSEPIPAWQWAKIKVAQPGFRAPLKTKLTRPKYQKLRYVNFPYIHFNANMDEFKVLYFYFSRP